MNNNCLVLEEGLEYYPVDLPRSIPYKAEFVVPLGSLPNNCFAEYGYTEQRYSLK